MKTNNRLVHSMRNIYCGKYSSLNGKFHVWSITCTIYHIWWSSIFIFFSYVKTHLSQKYKLFSFGFFSFFRKYFH